MELTRILRGNMGRIISDGRMTKIVFVFSMYSIFSLNNFAQSNPDLSPNFSFTTTSIVVGESITILLNVNNIVEGATNGSEVEIFIPNISGINIDLFQDDSTNSDDRRRMEDSLWSKRDAEGGIFLTSTGGITGNSASVIPLIISGNIPGTNGNLVVNITPESGGEQFPYNNIAVLSLSVQNSTFQDP